MRLLLTFARSYPRQSAMTLAALVAASLAEALGLTTVLPLLTVAAGSGALDDTGLGSFVAQALATLGLSPTIGGMLVLVVAATVLKSGILLISERYVGYAVADIATGMRLEFIGALLASRWEHYVMQRSGALASTLGPEASRAGEAYRFCAHGVALALQAAVYTIVAMQLASTWRGEASRMRGNQADALNDVFERGLSFVQQCLVGSVRHYILIDLARPLERRQGFQQQG